MDESNNHLLSEIYKLTEENNKYLKRIDRRQRWGTYFRVLMFIIALGSAFGVYYILQPYFDNVSNIYNQAQSSL